MNSPVSVSTEAHRDDGILRTCVMYPMAWG